MANLDERIARYEALGTSKAERCAIELLFEKAELVLERDGGDAALPCFLEVFDAQPGIRTPARAVC